LVEEVFYAKVSLLGFLRWEKVDKMESVRMRYEVNQIVGSNGLK